MKHLLIVTAVAAAMACTNATAQDWSGWYAGADAGFVQRSATSSIDGTVNSSGTAAGISIGHWWQTESFVWGWDGGLTFGGAKSQIDYPGGLFASPYSYSTAETVTTAIRLKFAMPVGAFLPYVAIGPQYVHATSRFAFAGTAMEETSSVRIGMTLSAGAEAMISDALSVKAEYGLNLVFPTNSSITQNTGSGGKIGLNYHFN